MLGNQYVGLVTLGETLVGSLLVCSSSGTPINSDALPSFRVYGPGGFLTSGSCSLRDTAAITGATNASPIVITSAGHGLTNGARVTVAGVAGNTAANGTFIVANVTTDTFELAGSAGNGDYTTGGAWNVTGLYEYSIDVIGANGFEITENCQVNFTYAISATEQGQTHSFNVT